MVVNEKLKAERLGQTKMMNNGMTATIIEYRTCMDVDIKFEDGYVAKNRRYDDFVKGHVKHKDTPNSRKITTSHRVGETGIMNNGMKATIIEYRKARDIDIQFEDGYIAKHKTYRDFIIGNVKNPFIPNVCGVEYVGNAYTQENKKDKLSYIYWRTMITRCYSDEYHKLEPTYIGCEVCDEWKCYENFEKWCNENYYEVENERTEIDKDILIKGNKIYSPETCVFIPQRINKLFTKNQARRGDYPIGVSFDGYENKFRADCQINGKGKTLGRFKTPEEAFKIYKKFKEEEIKRVADEYKYVIPKKLYDAMCRYEVEITD